MTSLFRRYAILLALLCWLAAPLAARGDGVVIDRLGRYVPEKEQVAFIEWEDGWQRLYVATRTEPTDHPSLWIVPIPAAARRVQAEPVEAAPRVVYYQKIIDRARQVVNEALMTTVVLDTGLLPCGALPFISFGCGDGKKDGDYKEHGRVEKHGMVVTVVTARSAEALDRYLKANAVSATAANLVALAPYLGQSEEFALVCGWQAKGGSEMTARAVRVDFPTPTIFYPLQPTRVYESEVRTAIYVRGLVRPTAGVAVPGVKCHTLRGVVQDQAGIDFGGPRGVLDTKGKRPPPEAMMELLTRIELTSEPATWTSDLYFEPGTPAAVNVALFLDTHGLKALWGASVLLGALLAALLPWAVVPAEQRRWSDCLWASAVGAATGLSVWASALAYLGWMVRRAGDDRPEGTGRALGRGILWVGGMGGCLLLLLLFLAMIVGVRPVGSEAVTVFLAGLGLSLLAACSPLLVIYLLARRVGWPRTVWFVAFMAAHGGLACSGLAALDGWLATAQ